MWTTLFCNGFLLHYPLVYHCDGIRRYTSPNEEITHVIVGDRSLANPELVSALEAHACSPALVTASWLLETCRAGRMLATDG